MTAVPLAPTAVGPFEQQPDVEPFIESWRVVAGGTRDAAPVTDATVRLRMGDRRVVASGEARDAESALDGALKSALEVISREQPVAEPPGYERLRAQCGLPRRAGCVEGSELVASAIHQDALLGRLAVSLNTHEIARFSYVVEPGGTHANVVVQVRGERWDVERVANRLRRVVGVTSVVERS